MSVIGKNWKIQNNEELSVIDKIRENKGLTNPNDLEKFLKPDFAKDFHDPFLMSGMSKAVTRVEKAIKNNERIVIYGDYDVDGISAAAILLITLQQLGAEVSYRLPHRVDDGYGLHEKYIDEFIKIGVSLVITVDCGISNADQIAKAKENGIDVIITDHHSIPEKYPEAAYEILHPKLKNSDYPFKELTGAGVAFKFAHALLMNNGHEINDDSLIFSLLDLASLGTVADCGPIVGENRLIVKKGLEMLAHTKWEGLRFLQETAGIDLSKPLSTYNIGFQIAPRINAAGRIDSPYYALQLLIQDKQSEMAKNLAQKLEELNIRRQQMLKKALKEAENRFLQKDAEKIIIEHDANWHVGIVGLIAGRLAEKYNRPVIILQDFEDYLVASARSPEFFNIIEAISEFSDLLESFGGHAQAAGFNIKKENLKDFIESMKGYVSEKIDENYKATLNIDCEIKSNEINWETLKFIESLKPYGIANETPSFLLKNVNVENVRQVGKDAKHLTIGIKTSDLFIRGIAFNMGKFHDYVREHNSLDLVFNLDRNDWNGKESLQLKIIDFSVSNN